MAKTIKEVKADFEREPGETYTDGDGFTWTIDAFGTAVLVGAEGFEPVEVDDGRQIDFPEDPVHHVYYLGARSIELEAEKGREAQSVLLHRFRDVKTGQTRCAWGFYMLDKGLAEVKQDGKTQVILAYRGEDPISKGRTMKRIDVLVKGGKSK